MKIYFLGANRQVTGSRYLVEAGGRRVMVDCGMFQERDFLGRNWEACPIQPSSINHLLLTHAHLDHSGLIPKLVSEGYNREILTTAPSRDLAEIIMRDSAHIQEEDAKFKRKRHAREQRKARFPEEALYTDEDVDRSVRLFKTAPYDKPVRLNDEFTVTFHDAGHILGSAMLELAVSEKGQTRTIVFSGDLGQWDKPIIRDPTLLDRADYVVMESTYGDRDHKLNGSIEDQLADIINETVARGGNVLIPTFAIERAQELVYHMGRLARADRIPDLMVFLDSPMAVDVTAVFQRYSQFMDEQAAAELKAGATLFQFPGLKLVRHTSESKAINRIKGSCVIMAGSGMCNAGRIKHHLAHNLERPECTVLFVGYQSAGTLGREILDHNPKVRIHGAQYQVRAKVAQITGLSAHADRSGLMKWLGHLREAPRRIFLTHGEESAAMALAEQVRREKGWAVEIPQYRSEWELD